MEVTDVQKMKVLEEENTKLKKIFANQSLEIYAIKDLLEKSSKPFAEEILSRILG